MSRCRTEARPNKPDDPLAQASAKRAERGAWRTERLAIERGLPLSLLLLQLFLHRHSHQLQLPIAFLHDI